MILGNLAPERLLTGDNFLVLGLGLGLNINTKRQIPRLDDRTQLIKSTNLGINSLDYRTLGIEFMNRLTLHHVVLLSNFPF